MVILKKRGGIRLDIKRNLIIVATSIFTMIFGVGVFASNSAPKSSFTYILYFAIAAAVFLIIYMLYAWYANNKVSYKEAEVSLELEEMAQKDSSWDEEKLLEHSDMIFYQVQNALANKDIEALQEYLHPSLFEKWESQVKDAESGNYSNMAHKQIEDIKVVDIDNYIDNERDTYAVAIDMKACEYTVDNKGRIVFTNEELAVDEGTAILTEYWKFERHNDDWKLVDVSKSSHWKEFVEDPIINEEE